MNLKTHQVINAISRTRHDTLCHAWIILICIAGFMALGTFHANSAQVVVIDDGTSFTPDPVMISPGDSVLWKDDGTGPYQIISDTGAWTTFSTPGAIRFTQAGSFSYHDDLADFGTVQVNVNLPPSVTITNPAANIVFTPPATFLFGADASDPDADGVSDVKFYVGTNLIDDVFSSPYTTTVTNLAAGTYTLTVIAFDNGGASATNSVTIQVCACPSLLTLSSPRIVAGQFQFNVSGLVAGKTNVLLTSTNLLAPPKNWVSLSSNVAASSTMTFTNATLSEGFFRLIQLP